MAGRKDALLPKIRRLKAIKHEGNSQVRAAQVVAVGKTVVAIRNPTVVIVVPGTRPNEAGEVPEQVRSLDCLRQLVDVVLLVLEFHCSQQ